MSLLIPIFVLFCLSVKVHFITACSSNPSQWSAQERTMYTCLTNKGLSVNNLRGFYNRVFNSRSRSGRVSWADQMLVVGCISRQDFLKYGIIPDPPPPPPPRPSSSSPLPHAVEPYVPPPPPPPAPSVIHTASPNCDSKVAQCLVDKGWTDQQIPANTGYNSVIANIASNPSLILTIDPYLRSQWRPHVEWIYKCLKDKILSDDQVIAYYDRVLNNKTRSGRVSLKDQHLAAGCITIEEFETIGLDVENKEKQYVASNPNLVIMLDPSLRSQWSDHDHWVYQCLKMNRFSDDQVKAYYDRVLNPKTRSGLVTAEEQNLVGDCISIQEFKQCGLDVEKFEERSTSEMQSQTWKQIVIDPSLRDIWDTRDQWIYLCLKYKGFSDDQVKAYYDRVLNPMTRSGRVSVEEQNAVTGCITTQEF